MKSIIKQLYLIYQIFDGYKIKIKYLVKIFNQKHEYFFKQLNSFFKQTQHNYDYLKDNKFYRNIILKINLIFDMYYLDNQDENIIDVFNQLIKDIDEYQKDLNFTIDELEKIKKNLMDLNINLC